MSGYKLYYFNIRARGEICRLAFAATNLEFEDIRLQGEEWAKEKATGRPPLGQMPFVLTPEGKALSQSVAIMKYICKKGGLSPDDNFDEAVADMITDTVTDMKNAVIKAHFEKDGVKKEELNKEFYGSTLPARLKKFDSLLKGPFLMGDKLTYADIMYFDFLNGFLAKGEPNVPEQLDEFPTLVEHYNRVLNVPEIKAWVENRPKTNFFI